LIPTLLALAAIGLAAWLYLQIILPFFQMRRALERLARRDFRPVLLNSSVGLFRRSASRIRQISELLQEQDRQIADEGFSLRAILSSMVEGVMIVDRSLRIRLVNEALGRMLGVSQSPMNRSVIEVFRDHRMHEAVASALREGGVRKLELTLDTPGPEGYAQRVFEVYAVALTPAGELGPFGAVVVLHDITQLKHLEAMRREFVANVSHEFRTPLSIINGYIETLSDGALDDRPLAERALRVMRKHGERLKLLIDDLLSLSRLEGRATTPLEFQRINLAEELSRVIDHLEPAIRERKTEIAVRFDPGCEWAEADPHRIEQVYVNLLSNSLRYGESETPRIEVTARLRDGEIEMRFSDNGPGIPPEDQPHIFERFYRVHKDRSRDGGGTGLGLSIVKNVVLAHGGRVAVESAPGSGATFLVVLPLSQG